MSLEIGQSCNITVSARVAGSTVEEVLIIGYNGAGCLSQEDINRMVLAEQRYTAVFAVRQAINEAKNNLESCCLTARAMLREASPAGVGSMRDIPRTVATQDLESSTMRALEWAEATTDAAKEEIDFTTECIAYRVSRYRDLFP